MNNENKFKLKLKCMKLAMRVVQQLFIFKPKDKNANIYLQYCNKGPISTMIYVMYEIRNKDIVSIVAQNVINYRTAIFKLHAY